MTRPFISLLTDFGLRDPSAAIVRATVLRIAPEAEILDISHEVRKYRIRDGALLLWCALPYLPVGFHVAVVDPGVGTARRPIAARTARGDVLIGPDNGLLTFPAERAGGIEEAVLLENPAHRLRVVSTSFHGRDIFAPAAAHLANGVPLGNLGPAVDPETLVDLDVPRPTVGQAKLEAHVLYVDTFGNVKLTALAEQLHQALPDLLPGTVLRVTLAERATAITWRSTFGEAEVGQPLLYEDSYGRLCLAVNQGDAAASLGLREDLAITIERS
jgi:S-adenosylmethionine hydrolase